MRNGFLSPAAFLILVAVTVASFLAPSPVYANHPCDYRANIVKRIEGGRLQESPIASGYFGRPLPDTGQTNSGNRLFEVHASPFQLQAWTFFETHPTQPLVSCILAVGSGFTIFNPGDSQPDFNFMPRAHPFPRSCGSHDMIMQRLKLGYDETVRMAGIVASNQTMVEILTSPQGTWTVVQTNREGISCLLASGYNWEDWGFAGDGMSIKH